jgi:hypothetical protein
VDHWAQDARDSQRDDRKVLGADGQPLQDLEGNFTIRGMLNQGETDAINKALGHLAYQTPEGRQYDLLKDEYYGNNDPVQRELKTTYDGIRYASIEDAVEVLPGVVFTPEQLSGLDKSDRNVIARVYAEEYGFDVDASYAARDAVMAEHPEMANGMPWWEYAQQYPGGAWAAFDATATVNPNVARLANDPKFQQLRRDNPDDALNNDVKYLDKVIAGVKDSRFDFPVDKKYAGVVGGLDGTLGAWKLGDDESGADEYQDWGEKVQADMGEYEKTVAALDAFDPSGASSAEYRNNIATGAKYTIPNAAYKSGIRGFIPDETSYLDT